MSKKINFDVLKKWILNYFNEHGKAPRMEDYYIQLGAPYNKMLVLEEYGSLSNLYSLVGISPRSVTTIEEKNRLLKELRDYVYRYKTTDRDFLRKRGLSDRSVYERVFGSWSKALRLAGIGEKERCLLRYFPDYEGEEYVEFLKKKIGRNGDFTPTQYEIINKAKRIGDNSKALRNSFNFQYIKKHFYYMSILQIICGYEINLNYKSGKKFIAMDGHECDSQQEALLDDWLYESGFEHEVHERYPNSRMVCDFKVGNVYIEYAGLMNTNSKTYQDKIKKKIDYCKKHNLVLYVIDELTEQKLGELRILLEGTVPL